MRALILAAGLAFAGAGPGPSVPATAAGARFEILLTPTSTGYDARCQSGCHWQTLSFTCAADCHAVIDANGVYPEATATQGDAAFAFRFYRLPNGWRMESLGGTGWETLGWGCGTFSCTARVTERGVSGPA